MVLGNNVLAQVPGSERFRGGIKILLKPGGVLTMEFPHLLDLIRENQFDTIYHEHFSYFSFLTAERIFGRHGITLFDVEDADPRRLAANLRPSRRGRNQAGHRGCRQAIKAAE